VIENFAKTWSFTPARVERPESAGELARIVRAADKVRVMGARHSWSRGIVTHGTAVTLDGMKRVVKIDREARTATVQGGIRLKELIPLLAREGMALSNLGSISEQTLAGAISTATHGTGIAWRCLADQVASLRMIDGRGDERVYRRGQPELDAVVTGLGACGVIFEVELDVVPEFQLHAVTETSRLEKVIATLDERVRAVDHFKLWWLVPSEHAVVFANTRTDAARDDREAVRWFRDELMSVAVYRSLVAVGKLDRARLIPPINRFLTRIVGRRFERTCASPVGFLTPVPPVHRETEWAFDYARAPDILEAYRRMLLADGHTYNFVQEIRFTRADGFWLSPAYGRDSVWLSMYNIARDAPWTDQMRRFEEFARSWGGRPHWGKEATFDRAHLEGQYEKLPEFRALQREHDPRGVFVNGFLERIL
jgi:FAD/FMN-containing dehydrogenase